jgi:N-acetylmuramoyl-L-alanine amidase
MQDMHYGYMRLIRGSGWVAVIVAASALLVAGMACRMASAPSARANGASPEEHSRSAGAGTSPGQSQDAAAAIDPAYFSPGACVAFPPERGDRHLTAFLDAGHGGADPGAVGITRTGQVIYEADQTLPVVLDTATILRRAGFRVVLSRTGPTSVLRLGPNDMSGHQLSVTGLHDDVAARDVCADMAHANALIGVYFNSGASAANAGCITAYDSARPFAADNRRLAGLVQSAVLAAMNAQGWQIPDAGVQSDQGLGSSLTAADLAYGHLILLGPAKRGYFSTPSTMPGALVEPLFITDPFEGSIAASSHGQQVIAAGLARAIEQYFAPGSAS